MVQQSLKNGKPLLGAVNPHNFVLFLGHDNPPYVTEKKG
jgi:hypothetical protein